MAFKYAADDTVSEFWCHQSVHERMRVATLFGHQTSKNWMEKISMHMHQEMHGELCMSWTFFNIIGYALAYQRKRRPCEGSLWLVSGQIDGTKILGQICDAVQFIQRKV